MNFRLMAAAAASVLALAGTANADEASTNASTLRALGAQVRLRIGTAANPTDLSDPALSQITADQFSVLTPENEMKWQVVEPTAGQLQLDRRRQPCQLRRAARSARARAHAGVAQPAAELADAGRRQRHDQRLSAARSAAPAHHHRGGPLPRQDLAVGRRQRVARRCESVADQAERLLGLAPRPGHHRRRVPLGARGRPGGVALLQRLQHRR